MIKYVLIQNYMVERANVPKVAYSTNQQEIHLWPMRQVQYVSLLFIVAFALVTLTDKCYSLVRLLICSLSRWASRGQQQRLALGFTGLLLCPHLGWWWLKLKWYQWDGTKWHLCSRVISGQLSATDDGLSCEGRRRLKDDGTGVHDLSIWGCQFLEKEMEGGTGGVGWGDYELSSEQIKFEGL